MRHIYLTIIFSFFLCQLVRAQVNEQQPISVSLQNADIQQFVNDLETKTGYHFYFEPKLFDSLKITLQVNQKPLATVLNLAFQNTNYYYAIVPGQRVLLSKGHEIKTELADGFFGHRAKTPQLNGTQSLDFITDEKEKKIPEATTENKTYEIGIKTNDIKSGNATIAGYVRDVKTGEPIIGATIYVADSKSAVATDQFGFYSLTMPKGKHILSIRSMVTRDTRRQVILYSDGKLNIELQEQILTLKEVKISAEKIANVRSLEMGVNRLDIKSIKEIPAIFGEADVLRAVLILPGVQTVGEATTGFNVRGGSADQNLILLNDAVVYNPAHFFGFFSAFNPDIIKDVQLYKSTIPEKFGGRLASVLDVNDREGNKKKFTGTAGLGLLTSRISFEGPIVKDKTSFLFGARTTYSNWLLQFLPETYKHSKASFYDINLDISHQINEKNNLYLYGYISSDSFKLNGDTSYSYSNKNLALKWKHTFNNKLYSVVTGAYQGYQYSINSAAVPINAYNLDFKINQSNFKADFNYYASAKHTIDFGVSSIYYNLQQGNLQPVGTASLEKPDVLPAEQALESAIYAGDKFDITDKLSLNLGLRYSLYNFLGPRTVNYYAPNLPRTSANLVDSVTYKKNQIINTYHGPEIRAAIRYSVSSDFSLKASYNTLRQYIHLLTNTTSISPTDVWQLSDPNIKPQYGDQLSFGIYKNLRSNTIETSVEVYYKHIKDYLDYKSGANLLLNHHIETDVINTQGKAYGIEFLIRKKSGKLNGLLSYTYSRTFLKQDDPTAGELINNGDYYPANYDKPHDFNFTGNYRFTHRVSFSLNTTYSTGRPITLPIAKFNYAGSDRVIYSDRNAYRIPDYFRTDFSINIDGNHNIKQLTHSDWTIGIYNVTGRQNAYSTYFSSQGGVINGYQLSIFASAIPFINYNIRF
ncbi:TonB-dependent receptor-like protein [Mucilaginibacter gracilis]|uniref:TonB-dependent receptor-like protein n=1 Tax=Mucilaginibacter gracilis TaxID=423350 RepID=A0A495J700_9SPHI|nr:TonB-dependent receptor [Mucilaginibacter gracilis]RKR84523.1 TonB-dependent receptor-like protein [Mucilaginibacter gracilis]